jgi:hypothetical protein
MTFSDRRQETDVDPFAALGLPASPDLTDDEVRQAWRAVAAAAHPDRAGGGDPTAYTAAAAAYAQLRTPWGRSEALADLPAPDGVFPDPAQPPSPSLAGAAWRAVTLVPARVRRGRRARMAARTLTAAMAALLAVRLIPGTPSEPAVVVGCALWWALTIRSDLAPPPGR